MLEALTGKRVRALDFSDDRLASLLAQIGDRAAWQPFEQELSGGLLRVTDEPIGVGFEIAVVRTATFTGGSWATWTERTLAFSSFERATSEAKKLDSACPGSQSKEPKAISYLLNGVKFHEAEKDARKRAGQLARI